MLSRFPACGRERLPEALSPPAFVTVSDTQEDRLLLAGEVAEILQVTTGWVYAETRRHRLPHVRLGRYVRYRRSAIDPFHTDAETASLRPRHATRPGPSFSPTLTG